jgi:very-short-patch-repair endonuclease
MSLNKKSGLVEIAKVVCRDLRRNETEVEKIFWEAVRSKKLYGKKFYRQYPFFYDITGKETFFVADFFCFEEKLIIELDGKYHKYRLAEDENRTEILNSLGIKLIRFANEEILNNLNDVLFTIRNNLRVKGTYPNPSPFKRKVRVSSSLKRFNEKSKK